MRKINESIKECLDAAFFCINLSFRASKKHFCLRIAVEMLLAFFPFVTMFLGKDIINFLALIPKENMNYERNLYYFLLLISALLGVEIAEAAIQKIKEYCGGIHKDLIGREIREQICEKAASLDLSYFDSPNFYNEITNATMDSHAVETLTWFIIDILRSMVQFVISVMILVRLSPVFAFIIIAAGIPSLIYEKKVTAKLYNWQREFIPEERKMGYLIGILTDRAFAKDIRLFNIQKELLSRYAFIWKKWFDEKHNLVKSQSKKSVLMSILPKAATTGALLYVGIKIISGSLTIGDYALYSGVIGQITGGLLMMINMVSRLYDNNMRIVNYSKFMRWESNIKSHGGRIPELPMEIEFYNVSFKYPGAEEYVLKNVRFTIKPKEKIALVGLNGAGKSTIVKLLLRYYDPTEGQIFVNGVDLKEYDINALRKCFSVLFQDYVNYAFTIRENIVISDLENRDDELKIHNACEKSGLDSVLDKFSSGLDTFLTRNFEEDGKELSGGEWQKLALARTFFRDSNIIILDEPSASLDPEAEHEVFRKFAELCEGRGAIFISHRLSNVTMADRIIVIDDGRVVEDGTHKKLMELKGKYSYLFNLQAEKYKVG